MLICELILGVWSSSSWCSLEHGRAAGTQIKCPLPTTSWQIWSCAVYNRRTVIQRSHHRLLVRPARSPWAWWSPTWRAGWRRCWCPRTATQNRPHRPSREPSQQSFRSEGRSLSPALGYLPHPSGTSWSPSGPRCRACTCVAYQLHRWQSSLNGQTP